MNQDKSIVRRLWDVSYPMMLAHLSMLFMLFVDRLFLAEYSPESLAATSSAGSFCWGMIFGLVEICRIVDVFIAQYLGRKEDHKIGRAVWQMIWFSFMTIAIAWPIGAYLGPQIFFHSTNKENEITYFFWMMFICPIFPLVASIGSFYIGRGQTKTILALSVIGNLINLILDYFFIFGIEGWLDPMGVKGAAIATGSGTAIQALVALGLMLHRNNRMKFGTGDWRFEPKLFLQCLAKGAPTGIFIIFEMTGWGITYTIMSAISIEHILVVSIGQSIVYVMLFFGLGIENGASVISGYFIGQKEPKKVYKVFNAGLLMNFIFSIALLALFTLSGDLMIDIFLDDDREITNITVAQYQNIYDLAMMSKVWIVLYVFTENIRFLINGVLRAAGDTMFIMLYGIISIWVFLLPPFYYAMYVYGAPIMTAFYLWVAQNLVALAWGYWRFAKGHWEHRAEFAAE
jgi:MATE family multidrug resistance protein